MVELVVDNIFAKSSDNRAYMLMLRERNGLRRIVIALGLAEAQSILFSIKKTNTVRPLTHELFNSFANAYGIKMDHVLIHRIDDGVFCSTILFDKDNELRALDARTSDAIALALRAGAPIFMPAHLLNRTCIHDEQNGAISLPLEVVDEKALRKAMNNAVQEENYELAKVLKEELDSRHTE